MKSFTPKILLPAAVACGLTATASAQIDTAPISPAAVTSITAQVAGSIADSISGFLSLAEGGDAHAQFSLGMLYAEGESIPEDDAEAVKWYRKAAEQGHSPAQHNLGMMYANGEGVPEDYTDAYKWFVLAEAGGDEKAPAQMRIIEPKMTAAQVAKARRLAAEWQEAHDQ